LRTSQFIQKTPDTSINVAFPNDFCAPPHRLQLVCIPLITLLIFRYLLQPISSIRRWRMRFLASVAMPKASVYENGELLPGERQIGCAWQVSAMNTVSDAALV
jgi:hypothetical protein